MSDETLKVSIITGLYNKLLSKPLWHFFGG